ncbi:MAG TPA: carbohydrate-binding protein [Chryseolinea sp.]|nr:carbohydrate-binding protein [Chryseolinea sp.]HPM31275.1 carbohydrate-binding protein [Chryseolinea sp.]
MKNKMLNTAICFLWIPFLISIGQLGSTSNFSDNTVQFNECFAVDTVSNPKKNRKHSKGKAWNNHPQQIPGKVQCEWYDLGGEGIAFHDTDTVNNGSGKLNPANGTFLNEFRMNEGVDISYTKARDIDNNPFNKVEPQMDQLYVGWTEPGEWINYTVNVKKSGEYLVEIMYTASGDGSISLQLDGQKLSDDLLITSTRNEKETIAWRQWHHWNRIDELGRVKLKKGIHVLTLKTIMNGNMNYDYLNFKLNE